MTEPYARGSETDGVDMRHTAGTWAIALVSVVLWSGVAILTNVFRNATVTWWTTAMFLGLAAVGGFLVLMCARDRHRFTAQGFWSQSIFGAARQRPWSAVSSVRYDKGLGWFVLRTDDGGKTRISALLSGFPGFAALVRAHVSPAALDA